MKWIQTQTQTQVVNFSFVGGCLKKEMDIFFSSQVIKNTLLIKGIAPSKPD